MMLGLLLAAAPAPCRAEPFEGDRFTVCQAVRGRERELLEAALGLAAVDQPLQRRAVEVVRDVLALEEPDGDGVRGGVGSRSR